MPKTVLYISELADIGGGERMLLSWIEGLDRAAYSPALLCACEGPLTERVRAAGVQVTVFPFGRVGRAAGFLPYVSLAGMLRFLGLFRALRPSLVHSNCFSGFALAALPARLLGVPLLWSDHGWTSGAGLQGRLIDAFASGVAAVSEAVRGFLLSGGKLAPGKVSVLPPGIDTDVFLRPADPAAARAEFSIPAGAPLVGIVGRLQEVKGHRLFLKAAARIAAARPDARFLVVGARLFGRSADEGYEEAVAGWIKEYGLAGKVVLTGFREDMPALLSCLDALVCSSSRESFCLTVAEALACGTPAVSTRCGGPEEIIEDGVSGLLVPPDDEAALAAAVLRVLGDGALAAALGRAGRARVERLYSAAAGRERLRKLYDGLAGGA